MLFQHNTKIITRTYYTDTNSQYLNTVFDSHRHKSGHEPSDFAIKHKQNVILYAIKSIKVVLLLRTKISETNDSQNSRDLCSKCNIHPYLLKMLYNEQNKDLEHNTEPFNKKEHKTRSFLMLHTIRFYQTTFNRIKHSSPNITN